MRSLSTAVLCGVALVALPGADRADDAGPKAVIDRAIKAHGGADKLAKFKASVSKSKGKFYGMSEEGVDYTGSTSIQLPDRMRLEVRSKFGDNEFTFVSVVRGDKGWIKIGDQTQEMDKDRLAESREQMNVANVSHLIVLRDRDYKLSPLGEAKVGDRAAVGVRVERRGYRDVSLYFDKERGLLLKVETRGKDPMSGDEFTAETLYDDYKRVEGMMVAHKVAIKHDGKRFVEGEVTEMKLEEKLDDGVFEKP